jgi:hypothetical protein
MWDIVVDHVGRGRVRALVRRTRSRRDPRDGVAVPYDVRAQFVYLASPHDLLLPTTNNASLASECERL